MPKSVHVISNPTAGSTNHAYLSAIVDRLKASGLSVSLEQTTRPNTAGKLAKATTADIIAVAGGDGTIREVINGLASRECLLAIIPTGTANVLAAEIGLKASVETVVSTITNGVPHDFFIGLAGHTYFSAMASVGFDADVVAEVNVGLKKRIGKFAYVWAAIRRLASYHPHRITIVIDGQTHHCTWALVLNGRYYAGMYTCVPFASITEDRLHVCLLQAETRLDILRFAMGLVFGRLGQCSAVQIVSGKNIQVLSSEALIQGDGDIIGCTPIVITSVSTGGLKLLIPPSTRMNQRACPVV